MDRLTYKLDKPYKSTYLYYEYMRIADYDIKRNNLGRITDAMIYNKLGKFEDFLEEQGFESLEKLKEFITLQETNIRFYERLASQYSSRWQKLKEYVEQFKEFDPVEADLAWKIAEKMKELSVAQRMVNK